jgi:hypothetical protein
VPEIATNGSSETGSPPCGEAGDFSPYSLVMPGATNDKVIGFMMSMVSAIARTTSMATCD